MSTPRKASPKGPRRSNRRPQQAQQLELGESTYTHSETDADLQMNSEQPATRSSSQKESQKNKRKSQASKKIQESTTSEATQTQSAVPQQERVKGTPIKQAYAGPTFHASPAPSTLPIPSFYSKSVPNISTMKPPDFANDSGADPTSGTTEAEKTADRVLETSKGESTPLDWMFEAARQSKGTPRAESPSARSVNLSVYGDSPYSRSPAPRDGDAVFPFELEGNDTDPAEFGDAFSTPYKERLEKLRPTSSNGATATMDDRERQAKSEALKKLLMHSQPPRSASASPKMPDPENPFNARAPNVRNLNNPPQHRHRSGPSTPVPFYGQPPQNPFHYYPPMPPPGQIQQNYHQNHNSPMHRPPSSQLRHVYQPAAESSPVELSTDRAFSQPLISTARKQSIQSQTPRQEHDPQVSQSTQDPTPRHKSKPSAQQLEDDLKRFLKMDLSSRG